MTLGDIISDYRNKHQLTMDDFAKVANISKAYVSMLEKNKNSSNGKPIIPSLPTLKKVATAINVSIDELLNLLDNDQPIFIPDEHDEEQDGNKEIMANNIKYYMELHDKDRRQVCLDLNIKYSTFSEWISGNKYPRIDKIEIMANYFGISKSDLVERRVFGSERQDNNLVSVFNILPAEKQNELSQIKSANFMVLTDENEQNLIKKYRTLNERSKKSVDNILDNCIELSQPIVKDEVG